MGIHIPSFIAFDGSDRSIVPADEQLVVTIDEIGDPAAAPPVAPWISFRASNVGSAMEQRYPLSRAEAIFAAADAAKAHHDSDPTTGGGMLDVYDEPGVVQDPLRAGFDEESGKVHLKGAGPVEGYHTLGAWAAARAELERLGHLTVA